MLECAGIAVVQGQDSSFVTAREAGCHGLAVCGKAVTFGMHELKSHGHVDRGPP